MATTTLNISLPEALKEHVQKRVAEGAFSNASDFVRALIRLDKERQEKLAALRRDIAEDSISSIAAKVSTASGFSPNCWTKVGSPRACPASFSRPRRATTFERSVIASPRNDPKAARRIVTRLRIWPAC